MKCYGLNLVVFTYCVYERQCMHVFDVIIFVYVLVCVNVNVFVCMLYDVLIRYKCRVVFVYVRYIYVGVIFLLKTKIMDSM